MNVTLSPKEHSSNIKLCFQKIVWFESMGVKGGDSKGG